MKKKTRKPGLTESTRIRNLKESVASLLDDLDHERNTVATTVLERDRLKGEVSELQRLLPYHATSPKGEQGTALDNEMIYLRRLVGVLENLEAPLRRRLLAMLDGRYFDPPVEKAK